MGRRVETLIDGERLIHMVGCVTDHDTACGIDMNDPEIGQCPENINNTVHLITCPACITIWKNAKKYRRDQFDEKAFKRTQPV